MGDVVRLEDVLSRDSVTSVSKSFFSLFGLPVRVISHEGDLLADVHRDQPLCNYLNTLVDGAQQCAATVSVVRDLEPRGEAIVHPCFTGAVYLRAIHWLGTSNTCGKLMTLETQNDRTLFFDMLPISMASQSGLKVRLKLFTVPGQVMHDATRRLVLQAVDGVVFVADSQRSEADANRESFLNLKKNLEDNGIDPERVPIIIQFNKRDLDDIRTDEELAAIAKQSRETIFKAVTTRGYKIIQTLTGLIRKT